FVGQSFGGVKAPRYLLYAHAYWTTIWGVAIALLLPVIADAAHRLWRLIVARPGAHGVGVALAWGAAVGVVAFVVSSVPAYHLSRRMMLERPLRNYPFQQPDWRDTPA